MTPITSASISCVFGMPKTALWVESSVTIISLPNANRHVDITNRINRIEYFIRSQDIGYQNRKNRCVFVIPDPKETHFMIYLTKIKGKLRPIIVIFPMTSCVECITHACGDLSPIAETGTRNSTIHPCVYRAGIVVADLLSNVTITFLNL